MENLEEINTTLKLINYYSLKIGNRGGCLSEAQYEAKLKKEALEKRLKELTKYLIQD